MDNITAHPRPITIGQLFTNGIARVIKEPKVTPGDGPILNLGCGNKLLDDSNNPANQMLIDLQIPDWIAPHLDFDENSVAGIHAYHFLEHLYSDEFRDMMSECYRVLKLDGVMNICVPYAMAEMAFQSTDHKIFFTEESWKALLDEPYYDCMYGKPHLNFDIHTNFVAGVVGRNLSVFTQLVKRGS